MIEVRYKCLCMAEEAVVCLPYRSDDEDVVTWVRETVGWLISSDHARRSPSCMQTCVEYVKIPMPENAPYIGGRPELPELCGRLVVVLGGGRCARRWGCRRPSRWRLLRAIWATWSYAGLLFRIRLVVTGGLMFWRTGFTLRISWRNLWVGGLLRSALAKILL